jgi:cytochrome P450
VDVIDGLAFPCRRLSSATPAPAEDRDRFKVWTRTQPGALLPVLSTPERQQRALEAGMHLVAYFTQLIAERRGNLGDDLMSALIRAEEEGDRLTMEELLANTIGLLVAGFETTMGLIGNGVRALLTHRDQLELLQSRPDLIACCRGGLLRLADLPRGASPTRPSRSAATRSPKVSRRWRRRPANRDPARFPDLTLRHHARRQPHLTPLRPHVPRAHLARIEAQVAIGTLVQRFEVEPRTRSSDGRCFV